MNNPERYSRRKMRGIVMLSAMIILLHAFYRFMPLLLKSSENVNIPLDTVLLASLQHKYDSVRKVEKALRDSIRPFNPSFITGYKAARLGLTAEQTRRLLAHRRAGKYINSPAEFQRISGVSDSVLQRLIPYFKFPGWVIARQKKNKPLPRNAVPGKPVATPKDKPPAVPGDINTATIDDLMRIKGIGKVLSTRIVKYRKKLKGYSYDDQLYEVWGLPEETAAEVLKYYHVITPPGIEKININTATFRQVLHLPYMDYELTKLLFDYRDEVAEIQSMEELKKIRGFPVEKFDRIILYLKAE